LQIIGAICQLVETSSNRICSGWRPLFSALKHITHNQQSMVWTLHINVQKFTRFAQRKICAVRPIVTLMQQCCRFLAYAL